MDCKNVDEVRKITSHNGAHAIMLCRCRVGTMVCVGLPANTAYKIPIGPFDMVVQGLGIVGSSVGTEAEPQELLALAEKRRCPSGHTCFATRKI